MFIPFVFTMDSLELTGDYYHWAHFYMYASACIKNNWPIISHERYFSRFSRVEETVFGTSLRAVLSTYCASSVPTTDEMLALKTYPITQEKENALIAQFASQFECWVDLLNNDNTEFAQIIGELLDRITGDFNDTPEGILVYEYLPKALLQAANMRGIPVIFQAGGVIRPPFVTAMNACCLINTNSAEAVKARYDSFLSKKLNVPMLSSKGLLRLFVSEKYMADVHNIDNQPEFDVGVLYNNLHVALYHAGQEYVSDQELSARAKEKYDKVLIRTRPGFEPTSDALDESPTCFHFCCKCKHVLGFATKGMFEAMLARRIPHEDGSFLFHSFSNNGIEDDSKDLVPVEFLNFVLFGMCIPFPWMTDPDFLQYLLSNPSEKEQYMRSFNYYTQSISKEDLALYYMSNNRTYRLGDTLYFTSRHKPHEYAAYYCLGGLHVNGEVCTWSNGESTSFEFDLTETLNEPLTISLILYDAAFDWNYSYPTQSVACEANGVDCGSITITPGKKYMRFIVPSECFTDKLQIRLKYSYLQQEANLRLAVAFERMYISRAGQRFIEDAMSNEIEALVHRMSGLEAHNTGLHAQVSELKANSVELEAQISELDAINTEQSARISRLEAHNAEHRTQISALEAKIQSIYTSRSWKLGNGIIKTVRKMIPSSKSP